MRTPSSRAALSTLAALAVLTAACRGGEEGPRRWVVANVHPATYPTARALEELSREVAASAALSPRLTLDLQLAGVLGNEKETLEKLRFGALQMVCASVAPLAEFSPEIGVLTLPYLFASGEGMWRALEGEVGRELLATLEADGFVGLAWYEAGARSFYNRRRPIRRLEDLQGLKIRVQRSEVMRRTVEALGASPVTLGFKDVYTSLHTGALDGAENNLPSYRSERHFEVAKHYSTDQHSRIPDLLLVRRESWEALAPEERTALAEAARRSSVAQRRFWRDYVAEAERAVVEAGSTIHAIEDAEAFRRAVEPVYETLASAERDWVRRLRAAAGEDGD